MSSSNRWIVGLCMNLFAQVIINLGTNCIKYAHVSNGKKSRKRGPCAQPWWVAGIVVFTLGNIIAFVSLGYAAQSLLSSLGSIQLVTNVFFARYFLKETITRRTLAATATVVAGQGLTIAFAAKETGRYDVETLSLLYTATPFVVYAIVVAVLAPSIHFLQLRKEAAKRKADTAAAQGGAAGASPATGGLGGERKLHGEKLIPVMYAFVSAMVGSLSVLLAKSLSELISLTVSGDNQFKNYFPYLVVIFWLGFTAFWMFRFNKGLRLYESSVIVPMLQVFWTFFSILCGGIYFGEFNDFSAFQTTMFILGVSIVIVGVYFLAPSSADSADNMPRPLYPFYDDNDFTPVVNLDDDQFTLPKKPAAQANEGSPRNMACGMPALRSSSPVAGLTPLTPVASVDHENIQLLSDDDSLFV